MTSNIICLFNDIIKESVSQKISLDRINEKTFFIASRELDNFLKIVFDISSSQQYSFSIYREKYGECDIVLFDNSSLDIEKFTLKYIIENKSFSYTLKSKLYTIKYNILKAIKIIPILGPDGVGKTTLFIETRDELKKKPVYKKFKKVVRRSIVYNIFYPINRAILKKKLGVKPQKDQHDDSYPNLIILAALLYYPYLVFITLIKKKVIFFDRFFHDYLFKNLSFQDRETTLRANWKTMLKIIPSTFWHIQLDAKSEIILTRKDELLLEDIDKFREYNFQMYLEKPAFIYSYINTGNTLENCKDNLLYVAKDREIIK